MSVDGIVAVTVITGGWGFPVSTVASQVWQHGFSLEHELPHEAAHAVFAASAGAAVIRSRAKMLTTKAVRTKTAGIDFMSFFSVTKRREKAGRS
jgi:hypothetical protein